MSVDLTYHKGTPLHYLALADRYNRWPELKVLRYLDTKSITRELEAIFEAHWYQDTLRSDGGPQFRSNFCKWCNRFKIRDKT